MPHKAMSCRKWKGGLSGKRFIVFRYKKINTDKLNLSRQFVPMNVSVCNIVYCERRDKRAGQIQFVRYVKNGPICMVVPIGRQSAPKGQKNLAQGKRSDTLG